METDLPQQTKGAHSDVCSEVVFGDKFAARDAYLLFKKRMAAVHQWTSYCKPEATFFYLTDQQGREVATAPEIGFYIKIDVPGPGSAAGEGFDWVCIEDIQDRVSEDEDVFLMQVRPSGHPAKKNSGTAHFFKDAATSTFMVRRQGNKVSAEVHGRNETVNTSAHKLIDKVRNAAIGVAGMLGISVLQWKTLTDGILRQQQQHS